MPAALDVDWAEVRRTVESGVTLEETAERFGIQFRTVQKRSYREDWLTTTKLEKMVAERRESAVSQAVTNTPKSAEIVADSLAKSGEKLRSVALKLSLNALEKVDVEKMPIKSWSDAATVFGMGAKAAGIDATAGPTVSILFGMDSFGYSDANTGVLEADVIEDSGEGV